MSETVQGEGGRRVLLLAAAVAIGIGAFWWATTLRKESAPLVRLEERGREFIVDLNGQPRGFAELAPAVQAALAQTLRTVRLPIPPEVKALAGEGGVPPGHAQTAAAFRVLSPIATAVADGQPRFSWTPAPDATGYKINIAEQTSGALLISHDLPATAHEWSPSAPLPAGQIYEWEVAALREGNVIAKSPASPEMMSARFEVLEEGRRAELEEWKDHAAGSHLLLGIANARAGLMDAAAEEFRALARENPNSQLAQKLLEQTETRRVPTR